MLSSSIFKQTQIDHLGRFQWEGGVFSMFHVQMNEKTCFFNEHLVHLYHPINDVFFNDALSWSILTQQPKVFFHCSIAPRAGNFPTPKTQQKIRWERP